MNKNEQIIQIARELPEWFTDAALETIKKDLETMKSIAEIVESSIIGFIIYSFEKHKCLIKWLAVKKEFQGKGIGKKLIYKLVKKCKQLDIKIIETDTLADTENYEPYVKTRAFYHSVGFKDVEIIKKGYEDGDDKLILQMDLKSSTDL